MASTSSGSREAKSKQAVRRSEFEPEALERPITLAEAAYESVATSLMEGGYVPGDRLVARALAAQLGVSLTPAREAVFGIRERLWFQRCRRNNSRRFIVYGTRSSRQRQRTTFRKKT